MNNNNQLKIEVHNMGLDTCEVLNKRLKMLHEQTKGYGHVLMHLVQHRTL